MTSWESAGGPGLEDVGQEWGRGCPPMAPTFSVKEGEDEGAATEGLRGKKRK